MLVLLATMLACGVRLNSQDLLVKPRICISPGRSCRPTWQSPHETSSPPSDSKSIIDKARLQALTNTSSAGCAAEMQQFHKAPAQERPAAAVPAPAHDSVAAPAEVPSSPAGAPSLLPSAPTSPPVSRPRSAMSAAPSSIQPAAVLAGELPGGDQAESL